MRRAADDFDRCPNDLCAEDLRVYFADFLDTHSPSSINIERRGLQFFCRYVLERPWNREKIVKRPRPQRLPDVLNGEAVHELLGSVRKLRYRVFFILPYSTGLRLGEGLALEVGDIDATRMRLHVRCRTEQTDRAQVHCHDCEEHGAFPLSRGTPSGLSLPFAFGMYLRRMSRLR